MNTLFTRILTLLLLLSATPLHAAPPDNNTITANGTYPVPVFIGKKYTFTVAGTFGGGSLAINWLDSGGNTGPYLYSPAPSAESWTFTAATGQVNLVLTGATAPNLTVTLVPTIPTGTADVNGGDITNALGYTPANVSGANIPDTATFRDAIQAGAVEGPILPLTLSRIMASGLGTYDPYRITGMSSGDSYAVDLTDALSSYVSPGKGTGMGAYPLYAITGGGVTTTDFGYSMNGVTMPMSASGHSVAYPITPKIFHKINVFYNTISGTSGTFIVEMNTEAGGWKEINTLPFSVETTGGVINTAFTPEWLPHGLVTGDRVMLSSTGTMPAGFSNATVYYVKKASDTTFTVSLTSGGADVIPTTTGTGTLTLAGGPGSSAMPIDTNTGIGIGAGVFSKDLLLSKSRQIRAVWKSGNVRVLGITVSDVYTGSLTKGGSEFFDIAASGRSVSEIVACPQAVINTILQTLKPDFITYKSDDSAADYTSSLQIFIDRCNAAWPMDWVFFSSHPASANGASTANGLSDADKALRAIAKTNGYMFVNMRKMFPTYDTMVSKNLINPDNYHLSAYGNFLQATYFMESCRAVLRPQRELMKWANRGFGIEYGPQYWLNPVAIAVENNTDTEAFSLSYGYGLGGNYSQSFGIQRNTDNSVQFNLGTSRSGHMGWDNQGQLQVIGGNSGWGYSSPPAKASRLATGTAEFFGYGWTDRPVLNLSTTTAHASDALRISKDTTTTAAGTRAAGINAKGVADFPAITLPPTTVANLPASPAVNQFATVNNATSFTAGAAVAGAGSVKCLVQYNGSSWIMVLQLY